MSSKEVVVIINLNKLGAEGISNVTVRGVEEPAFQLRPQVRIVQGRMFNWGAREVIAGAGITNRFVGAQIGEKVKFGGDVWTVVGIFDSEGSGFDSELWGDLNQIADAFKRTSLSTVTLRLKDPNEFSTVVSTFEADNRLQYFAPKREKKFFEEQSEMMATFIRILGIFITVIFSTGAMIGAMITMYGAVANRTVEIGTLRALGFFRRSILLAFLIESLFLSFVGGLVGSGDCVAAAICFDFHSQFRLVFGIGIFIRAVAIDHSRFVRILAAHGADGWLLAGGRRGAPEYYSGAQSRIEVAKKDVGCGVRSETERQVIPAFRS